jgi:hypothetical protein
VVSGTCGGVVRESWWVVGGEWWEKQWEEEEEAGPRPNHLHHGSDLHDREEEKPGVIKSEP